MQDAISNLIPGELLAGLELIGSMRRYAKHEMVIVEGDASDAFFVLVSGHLKVFTRDANGREVVYNLVRPGEIFGEMFLDGGTRSASVKATIESQCIRIASDQMPDLIARHPAFAEFLIRVLIGRLRSATHMIRSLVLNDVYERTIALLDRVAVAEGEVRIVPKGITQQEIADRVGATREMVNHVLTELMKGGFVSRDDERRLVLQKRPPVRW